MGHGVAVLDSRIKLLPHEFTSPHIALRTDGNNSKNMIAEIRGIRAGPIYPEVWSFYDDFALVPSDEHRATWKEGLTSVYRPMWTVSDASMVSIVADGIHISNESVDGPFFMTTRIPFQDGTWFVDFTMNDPTPRHLSLIVIHGGTVTSIGGDDPWNPNGSSYVHVNDCNSGGDNNLSVVNSSGIQQMSLTLIILSVRQTSKSAIPIGLMTR
jgi:hypothetical protein